MVTLDTLLINILLLLLFQCIKDGIAQNTKLWAVERPELEVMVHTNRCHRTNYLQVMTRLFHQQAQDCCLKKNLLLESLSNPNI